MENLNTKIIQINQKFKSNAFVSGIVNILILGLVFVFFSIGFDLTKKLLFDFINLSWGSILPSIVDLASVAGLIAVLKSFVSILNRPDFLLHLEDKVEGQNNAQVVSFITSSVSNKLFMLIWEVIGLFIFNCMSNLVLEGINDQLSPINELYLLSSTFTYLPIFPINLVNIVILMGIVLPTVLNYAKYKVEIAEAFDLQTSKAVNKKMIISELYDIKSCRSILFTVLAVMCIVLSIIQRNDKWIFQYNNPINEQNVLAEKLAGNTSAFCEENLRFGILHNQNVIIASVKKESFFNPPSVVDYSYAITPQLKQNITAMCAKRKQEDKILIQERKK